jgi:hypothetical protein
LGRFKFIFVPLSAGSPSTSPKTFAPLFAFIWPSYLAADAGGDRGLAVRQAEAEGLGHGRESPQVRGGTVAGFLASLAVCLAVVYARPPMPWVGLAVVISLSNTLLELFSPRGRTTSPWPPRTRCSAWASESSSTETGSVRAVRDLDPLHPPAGERDHQGGEDEESRDRQPGGVGSVTTVKRLKMPFMGSSTGKAASGRVTLRCLSQAGSAPFTPSRTRAHPGHGRVLEEQAEGQEDRAIARQARRTTRRSRRDGPGPDLGQGPAPRRCPYIRSTEAVTPSRTRGRS